MPLRSLAKPGLSPSPARRAALLGALTAAILSLGLASCARANGDELPPPPPPARFRADAEAIVARLSPARKAAEVLLVGVGGKGRPSAESLALLDKLEPGGVVLFGFNVGAEAAELGPFVAELQSLASAKGRLPFLVAIDHEGGSVFRFRGGITRLPSPASVGARGPDYAALLGRRAGLELQALGVNLALAPVVELLDEGNRELLGDRSYGRDPAKVDAAAGAFIAGLQSAGVAATAKHFPGNAGADPHKLLPVLKATRAEFERDFYPRFAAARRAGVGAVLLSHVLVPAVDPKRPATLSPALVRDELKTKLGFEGVVLTDDLYMKALAAERPPELSAVEALNAGADLLMLSAGGSAPRVRDAILRAVEAGRLPASRLDDAAARVVALKLRFGMAAALDPDVRAGRLAAFPALVEESGRLLAESGSGTAGAAAGQAAGARAAGAVKTNLPARKRR
ncbi:MAG: glycoside hydrolase family 3 protein [Spirochaetaceae bacterium]|nr:glycoside hydrolase family 3 protein [Spirochaetaceae bacterium]